MQNFAKNRTGEAGRQKAQPISAERLAIAANARMPTNGRPPSRQSGTISHLPSRGGAGNAQNTSAAIQPAPAHRNSGPKQAHDRYDTDAESIDTTVNQSAFQAEENQFNRRLQHGQAIDSAMGESEADEEQSDDGEGDEEEEQREEKYAHIAMTHSDVDFLENSGMRDVRRDDAIEYLYKHRRGGLPDIDGDSYPTTTDGEPSEWQSKQQIDFEEQDDGGPVSPSPQPLRMHGRPAAPASLQRAPIGTGAGQKPGGPHNMFNQGANIRQQQRATNSLGYQGGHNQNFTTAAMPSSQPPTYSQVTRQNETVPPVPSHAQPIHQPAFHQPAFHQPPQPQQNPARQMAGPPRVTIQTPPAVEARVLAKKPLAAPSKEVPTIQQPVGQIAPAEREHVLADYDTEELHEMDYAALKNESFDTDPRAPDQPLAQNMLDKPLVDRLEYVQKSFDAQKQAHFFRSLPTTEWEDAGDWFLEQFSNIITRTKEARQRKRKLAQGFESEVEKRHKHVSKKQRQVEDAMDKMKAQGEGLVPRTPRSSKSPKPKKGRA